MAGEDSTFAPLAVDETFTASEVFPSNSLLECAALCQVNINCTVMYFNSADKTCSSIKRDSVTWDNPTKTIFVESGYECK